MADGKPEGRPQHVYDKLVDLGTEQAAQMLTIGLLPEGWRGHIHDLIEHRRKPEPA